MDTYNDAKIKIKNGERTRNCFACWHASRVDGTAAICICYAATSKNNPPDLIYTPYIGYCPAFTDKVEIEGKFIQED